MFQFANCTLRDVWLEVSGRTVSFRKERNDDLVSRWAAADKSKWLNIEFGSNGVTVEKWWLTMHRVKEGEEEEEKETMKR